MPEIWPPTETQYKSLHQQDEDKIKHNNHKKCLEVQRNPSRAMSAPRQQIQGVLGEH